MKRSLADILAAQAKLYGQVDNATWFESRVANYRAHGREDLARGALEIAAKYGITVAERVSPGTLRRRQAGAA